MERTKVTAGTAAAKSRVLKFRKMHGIGNDFVMLDGVRGPLPEVDLAELARQMCDRRFGVGSDGLITMERASPPPAPSPQAERGFFRMRMWNPDGSEAEMCGNGVRCMARYLVDEGIVGGGAGSRSAHDASPDRGTRADDPHPLAPSPSPGAGGRGIRIPIETGAGLLCLEPLADGRVRVDMGVAGLTRGEIGMSGPAGERFVGEGVGVGAGSKEQFFGTAVSMGNPHLVIIVPSPESRVPSGRSGAGANETGGVAGIDLQRLGPVLERHPLFPNRVNVHFLEVVDRGHIVQRTWERGAGITLACGTGACACAVAAFLNGVCDRSVDVDLPGGRLHIDYAEDGRVFMTGPAETSFDGEWELGERSG